MEETNKQKIPFMVRVNCVTYNHALYIEDAMNGFCMQETTFPFVCIIVDDGSSDGELEVIKKYLRENFDLEDKTMTRNEETDDYIFTFARHRLNTNCYFAVYLLKYNHYSIQKSKFSYFAGFNDHAKYTAFCEGDDYWTDTYKIQKQVDYLENNPDCGLVYTNHYNRNGNNITQFKEKGYETFDDLVLGSGIGTLTACLRTKLYWKYREDIKPETRGWMMGDAPLWKYMSYHSKIKFLPDYTAVYRVLQNSASHFIDSEKRIAFIESGYNVKEFFINKYVIETERRTFLIKEANWKRIISIIKVRYANRQIDKLNDFLKDNVGNLGYRKRILCYTIFYLLKFKTLFK